MSLHFERILNVHVDVLLFILSLWHETKREMMYIKPPVLYAGLKSAACPKNLYLSKKKKN